jgi:hypothetical protein
MKVKNTYVNKMLENKMKSLETQRKKLFTKLKEIDVAIRKINVLYHAKKKAFYQKKNICMECKVSSVGKDCAYCEECLDNDSCLGNF